jgi:glycosyltransferase involved in cell wall biosynthesis
MRVNHQIQKEAGLESTIFFGHPDDFLDVPSADLRIWHCTVYHPLLERIRSGDTLYFHNWCGLSSPELTAFPELIEPTMNVLRNAADSGVSFITPSKFNQRFLMKFGVPDHRVIVLPLFHEYELHYTEHESHSPRLLAYGRYAANKAIAEIVANMAPRNINITVFGDNETLSEYTTEYNRARSVTGDSVKLLGQVENMEPYFEYANIYICNSYHEGFNLSAVEAMAHSLPVLLRRGTGMDELITPGREGFFFDDLAQVPDFIGGILSKYDEFSFNAFQKSVTYSRSAYRRKYLAVLAKVADFADREGARLQSEYAT